MFKKVFDVTFLLVPLVEPVPDTEGDDPDDDEEGSIELETTVVCTEDLSLRDFTNRLVDNKSSILDTLGYPDSEYHSTLIKVEDVSEAGTVVMLPQSKTH